MNETGVVDLVREAMWVGGLVAGPILVTVLLVGVVVGIYSTVFIAAPVLIYLGVRVSGEVANEEAGKAAVTDATKSATS